MTSIEFLAILAFIIHARETLEHARFKETSFTRKRGMTFTDALAFMLDMQKTSLKTRLDDFYEKGKEGDPITPQAFSSLRMNFDHSPFQTMVSQAVAGEYSGQYELPLFHGYHLFGIDGSYLQLPREDALRQEFGTRGRGNTCPEAGISVLFDVLHDWAVNPILVNADMNERVECEKHIDFLRLNPCNIAGKSILLLDRGYPSADLLKKLQDPQLSTVKFVARCNSQFLSEINHAPLGDSEVLLKNGVSVRIIKFVLPSGTIETLATNLFDLPEDLFPELYALRWGVETAYFKLKEELCVEKFSGKTPNSIRQDFWASMVLLNAVAVFQHEADRAVLDRQMGKSLKHEYRARTSGLIITLRNRFILAALCGNPTFGLQQMNNVIMTMAREVSPSRSGRSYPRNFKPAFAANHNLKSHL